jgi:hypothetical protein
MKLLIAVQQVVDATASKENNCRTPTVSGHQLRDLLRMVIVLVAPAGAAEALVTATVVAAAAAAGAHHTVLVGELVVAVIAGAEVTQTAMSPVSHMVAMMPTAELKKYIIRRPEAGNSDGFPAFSTQHRNQLLPEKFKPLGSPSMTRSKTQFNGLGVMPYPLKMLVATTT